VVLEAYPEGCTVVGSTATCAAGAESFSGTFDLDLSAVPEGQPQVVIVAVSATGITDEDDRWNDGRTVTMRPTP
jgi:hypothetical protein